MSDEQWEQIPATEKNNYLKFHELAYKEDYAHALKNSIDFPRWSIISGYYCMHDLTKLFLGKKFNIKISGEHIHVKTIHALETLIKDEQIKNKTIELLKKAENLYHSAERLKEKTIPLMLKTGKQERRKAQYYTQEFPQANSEKAEYFLKTIVEPYKKIIEELLKK